MTSIRRATVADARALHALAALTFPLACPPHTTRQNIDAFIARVLSEEAFAGYLADADRTVLLAEAAGGAIGYAMLVAEDPADPDVARVVARRPTVELSKLYVHPDHHGTGVAPALVADALEEARSRGAASVWLGVNQENARANRFYARHGFERVGTKRFLVGDRHEDDFVRERAL